MGKFNKNLKVRGNVNGWCNYVHELYGIPEIGKINRYYESNGKMCKGRYEYMYFRTLNRHFFDLDKILSKTYSDGKNIQRLRAAAYIKRVHGCVIDFAACMESGSFGYTTTRSGRECCYLSNSDNDIVIYTDDFEFVPAEDDMADYGMSDFGRTHNGQPIFRRVPDIDQDEILDSLFLHGYDIADVYYFNRNYYLRPMTTRWVDEEMDDILSHLDEAQIPYTVDRRSNLIRINIEVAVYTPGDADVRYE